MKALFKAKSYQAIMAWCCYDWASAAFSIVVTTFIFATYFTNTIAVNPIQGPYQWANATSLAGLLIAILSPLMGAIADHGGQHKKWLFFFTGITMISSALLWFAYPRPSSTYWVLTCVVLGTVAYEVALVFYNAFLPQLTDQEKLGRLSGVGWGCGYLGGIVALTMALFLFIKMNVPGLDVVNAGQIRICGPFVAVWLFVFSIPFFLFVPSLTKKTSSLSKAMRAGCADLVKTLKRLPQQKNIFLYLIAHMIYADGLNTLFAFGGIYAAGTYHLSFEQVLLFGISMNMTAGLGAIFLGWVDDWLGSKKTILISLFLLIVFALPLLVLHNKILFWGTALLLCVFVGPVQSASRTLMIKLIDAPNQTATEMFGLYALSGRITAFIGPWILGLITLTFNNQRVGMATILVFWALGALLLIPVKLESVVPKSE